VSAKSDQLLPALQPEPKKALQFPDIEEPQPQNGPKRLAPDPDREYIFTPKEKAMFDNFSARMTELNQQASGAAQMLITLHELPGVNWSIAPDNTRLIRKD